jgi:hypothetical protein
MATGTMSNDTMSNDTIAAVFGSATPRTRLFELSYGALS